MSSAFTVFHCYFVDGMSKKEKSGKKISKNVGNEDVKRDQKLQAIVLADTFKGYFNPITWNTSTMLLPLVNVPMIEYTIEFLAQNGVEEVINPFLFLWFICICLPLCYCCNNIFRFLFSVHLMPKLLKRM